MKTSDNIKERNRPNDTAVSKAAGSTTPQEVSNPVPSTDRKTKRPLRKRRKSKHRKLLAWLIVDALVAITVIALLLHKPSDYHPVTPPADANSNRVHPYIHRGLGSTLYNGAQSQKPFTMEVLDATLNEAIASMRWPQESGGVSFLAPEVRFEPGRIVLMGTAKVEGAELVITFALEPRLDETGRLSVGVEKVKVGAVNITPLARMVGRQKYQEYLETVPVDTTDIRAQVAAALLNAEPFDPVFEVEDKQIRLDRIKIEPGRLLVHFVPAQ